MSQIIRTDPFHIQAYKTIKENLLNNKHQPGEKLTESALASELGISRGPIREAMRMLMQDGLLFQKGSHTYVFKPSLQDAINLYLCRESLESLAARLATEHITDEDGYELENILRATRKALSEKDTDSVLKLNTDFHDKILSLSRNSELINLMEVIRAKIVYMRRSIISGYYRGIEFVDEHEEIARVLIRKDPDIAELMMKKHIRNDRDAFYKLFLKRVKNIKE